MWTIKEIKKENKKKEENSEIQKLKENQNKKRKRISVCLDAYLAAILNL